MQSDSDFRCSDQITQDAFGMVISTPGIKSVPIRKGVKIHVWHKQPSKYMPSLMSCPHCSPQGLLSVQHLGSTVTAANTGQA